VKFILKFVIKGLSVGLRATSAVRKQNPIGRSKFTQKLQHHVYYHVWATGWKIGVLGFDSRRGLGIFLFTTASRRVLGPTQPPIPWIPGALFLGVKRPGREADHSPPLLPW
jgi:hypothetical protein